jgi:hypothetical protein
MIDYVTDSKNDMHRDVALKIFKRTLNDFTKYERFVGKNGFTFPEFYGSTCRIYTEQDKKLQTGEVTRNIWEMMPDETKQHLESKNINNIWDFQKHLEKIESDFWGKTFQVYNKWKFDNWKEYKKNGYIELKTGFRCTALMGFNDTNNYPVQGSAFHVLLWSLIQINRFMRENNFKSKLLGQIHDSMVFDVHPKEKDYLIEIIKDFSTKKVRDHWTWINVPLTIECEVTEINGNWSEKKEIKI